MKHLILILGLVLVNQFSNAQMKDGYGSPDFKGLLSNGLTYITGVDTLIDTQVINALEQSWTATSYRILTIDEAKGNISNDDVILMKVDLKYYPGEEAADKAIILIRGEYLDKLGKRMALAKIDGFSGGHSDEEVVTFVPYVVMWLNKMVEQVKSQQIESENLITLNNKINEGISGEKPDLKGKTLLFVGDDVKYWIEPEWLYNLDVKNKFVSFEEFVKLQADGELNNYYVVYYYHDMDDHWTRFWLLDPEDNDIKYACRVNKPNPLKAIIKGLKKEGSF